MGRTQEQKNKSENPSFGQVLSTIVTVTGSQSIFVVVLCSVQRRRVPAQQIRKESNEMIRRIQQKIPRQSSSSSSSSSSSKDALLSSSSTTKYVKQGLGRLTASSTSPSSSPSNNTTSRQSFTRLTEVAHKFPTRLVPIGKSSVEQAGAAVCAVSRYVLAFAFKLRQTTTTFKRKSARKQSKLCHEMK